MGDLTDRRNEIMQRVSAVLNKANDFRNSYETYNYLWVDDRTEFMRKFYLTISNWNTHTCTYLPMLNLSELEKMFNALCVLLLNPHLLLMAKNIQVNVTVFQSTLATV